MSHREFTTSMLMICFWILLVFGLGMMGMLLTTAAVLVRFRG